MNSLATNSRIIPKIIRDKSGREALAFFAVFVDATGYQVKLVGLRYKKEQAYLPKAESKNSSFSIKSPYFSIPEIFVNDFSFLTSQPARAPNF